MTDDDVESIQIAATQLRGEKVQIVLRMMVPKPISLPTGAAAMIPSPLTLEGVITEVAERAIVLEGQTGAQGDHYLSSSILLCSDVLLINRMGTVAIPEAPRIKT